MSQLKKTLQDGTPDDDDFAKGVPSRRGTSLVCAPPSLKDSVPPHRGEGLSPPEGGRTPAATRAAPNFGSQLPDSAPGWMLRARRMSLALEEAIRNGGGPNPSIEASIERAWAAWELDGSSDKQIARIARLIENAHRAIRETPPTSLEAAYGEVSQVLWAGLPRHVKARQDFGQITVIVRGLRSEADAWIAVVDAIATLLGWSRAARAHSAEAVRLAIIHDQGE